MALRSNPRVESKKYTVQLKQAVYLWTGDLLQQWLEQKTVDNEDVRWSKKIAWHRRYDHVI